ncbi:hypothetical protein BASA81_003557 [Batrachochytrium salamandrivorans]|nr:hypothetical protein BASA81_003557 [Batrachochytrium salamandrivorans]
MDKAKAAALAVLQKHACAKNKYSYGTAGFRFEVDEFSPQVFCRTGMLAYFRSCVLGGETVGLCITASHNLGKDNGVKLIDPDGGMLAASWEQLATEVVNAPSNEECVRLLLELCDRYVVGQPSRVLLARDTRESSESLEQCAMEGISAWGGVCESLGLATTPQLHYCVMEGNSKGFVKGFPPSLVGYEQLVCDAYLQLTEGTGKLEGEWAVDCSNGIGGLRFASIAQKLGFGQLFNVDNLQELNSGCGAEFVQKGQLPPSNLPVHAVSRFASFDGDADRVVCFYVEDNLERRFHLLDGDKIASLFASFITQQLDVLGLTQVTIGTVQTAYANGSSTAFLRHTLQVEVPIVKTGVKHLHHQALEYDVGIYFEANGHGTVLFRPSFIARIQSLPTSTAKQRLLGLVMLLNQATGDAIADLLAVDAVLRVLEFSSFAQWNSLYSDLPSRQEKVKCVDRSVVEVNEDETRCVKPAELQLKLDAAVQRAQGGRVFVRPSGTENVIRVYAEANTQVDADLLAEVARAAICEFAGGISPPEAKRAKH